MQGLHGVYRNGKENGNYSIMLGLGSGRVNKQMINGDTWGYYMAYRGCKYAFYVPSIVQVGGLGLYVSAIPPCLWA